MNSLIYGHVTRPSPFIFVTKQKLKTVLFCIPLPYSWIALLLRSVSFGSTSADTAKTQFCRNFVISGKENSQIYTKLSADHNSSFLVLDEVRLRNRSSVETSLVFWPLSQLNWKKIEIQVSEPLWNPHINFILQ